MLKAEIKNSKAGGDKVFVMANGSLADIIVEVGLVINGVHAQLKQASPILAKQYRQNLTALLIDPETPLWKDYGNHEGVCITVPNNSKEDF